MPHPDGTQTYIRAAESTENIPAARRVRDVARRIQYLDPDAAPLTLILARSKSKAASNTKFEWIEKDLPARWDAINGTTGTGTSWTVDSAAKFSVGDIVNVVRTKEKARVTNVNTSTNVLTVVRGVGSTATAAVADNDDLQIIGNAYAEGAVAGTEKSHQETYPYNYLQIVRTQLAVTGSQAESENYTGPDRPRLRMEKAIEHKIDLERTALFGERNIDTTDTNQPRRYTGGFFFFCDENIKDMGGTMTEPEIETWTQDLFHHTAGSDTRLLMASPLAISVINQLAAGRIQTVSKEKTFGLSLTQWITGHGTLNIVKHRLLENGTVSSQGYGGYMLAVSPDRWTYRFLRNRNTKLLMDIQANDEDRVKDEYLTEMGWQVENPRLHGHAHTITG